MKKELDAALWAHTNLTIFSAIVSLLEGGVLKGVSAAKAAEKIRKICMDEEQRQLRDLDKATSTLTSKTN